MGNNIYKWACVKCGASEGGDVVHCYRTAVAHYVWTEGCCEKDLVWSQVVEVNDNEND